MSTQSRGHATLSLYRHIAAVIIIFWRERTGVVQMAAFNPEVKAKIVRDRITGEHLPCVMCGTRYPLPDAVHIIDKEEWCFRVRVDRQVNGMPLCANCHRIFDEVLRPRLAAALREFGAQGLPECWGRNNKLSVADQEVLPPDFSPDEPSAPAAG